MGLAINSDQRQHISLSTFAYSIIMSDIMTYELADTISGLVNIIIRNYHDRSDASINKEIEDLNSDWEKLLKNCQYKKDSRERQIIKEVQNEFVKARKDNLVCKMKNFPKNKNIKIRLQNSTLETLEEQCWEDIEYYQNSLAGYLKALLEDYARQTTYTRECVLFRDKIDFLENEILKAEYSDHSSRVLKITLKVYDYYEKSIIFKPYRITRMDELDQSVYVLGMGIDPENPDDGFIEANLDIRQIAKIEYAPKKYGSGRISKTSKQSIEHLLSDQNLYLFGHKKERILISFSERGLYQYFNTNTKDRPPIDVKGIRINGNHRYAAIANCTKSQAYHYFLPFGGDALILLPSDLSQAMMETYKKANYIYNLHSNKLIVPSENKEVDEDIERLNNSNDDPKVWNELIVKYARKTDSLEDVEAEVLFYQKAADLEYELSYYMLGDIYFENDFFKKNYEKAALYYEKCKDDLDPRRTANYASLIANGLVPGYKPEDGKEMLEKIKDRFHKEHCLWTTPEGYRFYSYQYKQNEHADVVYDCSDESEEIEKQRSKYVR